MIRLADFASYSDARAGFSWPRPERYNIAEVCCDRWARRTPRGIALIVPDPSGRPVPVDYATLLGDANRWANALRGLGVGPQTRVGVHLGQSYETVLAHLAVYKLGAVAVPLAAVFGPDAIAYRLAHSEASYLITTASAAERAAGHDGIAMLTVDGDAARATRLDLAVSQASDGFETAPTTLDTPALMIFTSGTTGQPKGALHGHRVLLGHLPGVQMHHDLMPQHGDRLWTPADWAWAGGLLNVLLPGLAMGVPVVAQRADRFDPEDALDWMERAGVRNAFIPPTALRMMRDTKPNLSLRSVGSGGEQLGAASFAWARERLGLTINEFYGQSECNLVLSSCAAWGIAHPGVIGRPVPGHDVAVIDSAGEVVADGTEGTIAIRAPDPVMFLGYWKDEAATREKHVGSWLTTGDRGAAGEHGITFVGRDDDVITSSGYRIGPGEIEDCLATHPSVALAAVVGMPDEVRGEIVAAFVKLNTGVAPSEALAKDVQDHVRRRLSAHEYPRTVTFVDDIPLTTTGKVIRRAFR